MFFFFLPESPGQEEDGEFDARETGASHQDSAWSALAAWLQICLVRFTISPQVTKACISMDVLSCSETKTFGKLKANFVIPAFLFDFLGPTIFLGWLKYDD